MGATIVEIHIVDVPHVAVARKSGLGYIVDTYIVTKTEFKSRFQIYVLNNGNRHIAEETAVVGVEGVEREAVGTPNLVPTT